MWWLTIQRCSSQASFVNSVLRSDSAIVELKSGTRSCPLFVDHFPSERTEIPDKRPSSLKFQGRCRMFLCDFAKISVLGSRRDHSLTVAAISSSEQHANKRKKKVTSNRQSYKAATRICLLVGGDIPCKKKNTDHDKSSRSGIPEIECVHLHTHHPSQFRHRLTDKSLPATLSTGSTLTRNIPPHVVLVTEKNVAKSIFATNAPYLSQDPVHFSWTSFLHEKRVPDNCTPGRNCQMHYCMC